MGGSSARNRDSSGSGSGTPTPRDYVKPPQTPPPRRPPRLQGSRMRSDSSVSAIIMTPDQPSTPVAGAGSRPVSTFLDHEQDMADLTAEMALLDDGYDTRTGRTITTRSGGGLRPLSLQYKPLAPRPRSSSDSDNHDDTERGPYTPTSRSSAPTFYALGGNTPTPLSYPEKPTTPTGDSGLTSSRLMTNLGKTFYRLRVVLRLLSVMGAGCVLGVLSHITAVYMRTKDGKDPVTDKDIWPGDGLDLIPTHMILAGAAVCLVAGLGWTVSSLIKGVRRLDGSVDSWVRWVAGVSAAFETLLWIIGVSYAGRVQNMPKDKRDAETLFWVCEAKDGVDSDGEEKEIIDRTVGEPVDFRLHCGEIRAAWFAAIAVSVVTFGILLTIIGGKLVRWWHRRRKGKGRMLSGPFEEPSPTSGLRGLRLAGGGKANIGGMGRKWAWKNKT